MSTCIYRYNTHTLSHLYTLTLSYTSYINHVYTGAKVERVMELAGLAANKNTVYYTCI